MERKASDVLLELEHKIDLILGYLKNIDFNNKLILNKLNASPINPLPQASESSSPKQLGLPRAEAFIKDPAQNKKEVEFALAPAIQSNLQFKPPTKQNTPPFEIDKKILVQQKVLYPDGKGVILANVEVFDSSKNLVNKTRTNNVGKWALTLEPGKYFVQIRKSGTKDKPFVEKSYDLTVPSSNEPLELETLQ